VTMNGAPYSSITSGRNGWNDIGGGCVSPTRSVDYWDYVSSSMIQNPSGVQDWIVDVRVYASDGSTKNASSIDIASPVVKFFKIALHQNSAVAIMQMAVQAPPSAPTISSAGLPPTTRCRTIENMLIEFGEQSTKNMLSL
jgi:hypothetical protein